MDEDHLVTNEPTVPAPLPETAWRKSFFGLFGIVLLVSVGILFLNRHKFFPSGSSLVGTLSSQSKNILTKDSDTFISEKDILNATSDKSTTSIVDFQTKYAFKHPEGWRDNPTTIWLQDKQKHESPLIEITTHSDKIPFQTVDSIFEQWKKDSHTPQYTLRVAFNGFKGITYVRTEIDSFQNKPRSVPVQEFVLEKNDSRIYISVHLNAPTISQLHKNEIAYILKSFDLRKDIYNGSASGPQISPNSKANKVWESTLKEDGANITLFEPIIYGSMLLTADSTGDVYILDKNSGAVLWKSDVGGPITAQPRLIEDTLYVLSKAADTSEKNRLSAISVAQKRIAWYHDSTVDMPSSDKIPVALIDKKLFYIDDTIKMLDPQSGQNLGTVPGLRYFHPEEVVATPSSPRDIIFHDNTIYVFTSYLYWNSENKTNNITVYSYPEIKQLWSRVFYSHEMTGIDFTDFKKESLFVGGYDFNRLYELDKKTGQQKSITLTQTQSNVRNMRFLSAGDNVYFIRQSGSSDVYNMDPFKQSVNWSTLIGSGLVTPDTYTYKDKRLFFANNDFSSNQHTWYVLDESTQKQSTYTIAGSVVNQAPAVENNRIFTTTSNGKIFAFDLL